MKMCIPGRAMVGLTAIGLILITGCTVNAKTLPFMPDRPDYTDPTVIHECGNATQHRRDFKICLKHNRLAKLEPRVQELETRIEELHGLIGSDNTSANSGSGITPTP